MDLLAVQLIQDNHPLPLWNIPVYSRSKRIRRDQDSVDVDLWIQIQVRIQTLI
jgi:hypothetical protein